MKQFCILLAFCAVVGAAAGEFYRLDLNKLEPGTVLVQTDAAGKMRSLRPTWGMWPRTPDSVGAKVIERDGAKVLEIEKGFQVNSSEWNAGVSDAQQSVAYCRISFLLPELSGKGLAGTLRLQQVNNRTAAFIGFEPKGEMFDVLVSNGDGNGKVVWQKIGRVEPNKWFTVDVKMDFNSKTCDVALNGGEWQTGKKFRHASSWEGTMWARGLTVRDYRYDIEANKIPVLVREIVFSSDPIGK